jgi:hypothetical protein
VKAVALTQNFGADRFRLAEEMERLVGKVGAQVQQIAAVRGVLFPGLIRGRHRTPAVKAGFKADEAAQRTFT